MIRFLILFICLLCFHALPSAAEDSVVSPIQLNLKSVLKLASEQSPSVIIGRASVQQIMAQIDDKKSILFPQIAGDISERRRTADLRSSGITFANANDPLIGPYNSFDARVKVTQKIFDPELKNRLDWLRDGKTVSELQAKKIEQDVLALAAAQYVQAVRARQTLEVTRAALARDWRHLRIIQKQFELGVVSDVEWNEARTRYLSALQQGRNARREWMRVRLSLMSTLGISSDQRVMVDNFYSSDVNVAADNALTMNADIRWAEAKVRMSQQSIASSRAEYWPKLALTADYGAAGEGAASKNSSETYTMGIEASIPIFDAGGRRNRIKTAEAEEQINQTNLADIKRKTEADMSVNRQMIADARAAVRQAQHQYRLAQERFDVARQQFYIGAGDEYEMLSSRVEMVAAQDDQYEAEALYVMSAVNLAHTAGSLDQWVKVK